MKIPTACRSRRVLEPVLCQIFLGAWRGGATARRRGLARLLEQKKKSATDLKSLF
jgi:hypothetical protein